MNVTLVMVREMTIAELFPFLPAELAETNIGIVALAVNFVVLVIVSVAVRGRRGRREQSV